jgi:hypothetical protein
MNKEQEHKIINRLGIIERVLLGWDSEGNKLSAGDRYGSLRLRISQDLGGHDTQIAPYNLNDIKQDLEVLKTKINEIHKQNVTTPKQLLFITLFWISFFIIATSIMYFVFYIN